MIIITGIFHTAEEWSSNNGYNLDKEGELATVRTHGQYFYFTIITLSTVGYGDIYPTTAIGQVVVLVAIMITIGYFAMKFSDIKDWLGGIYNSVRYARKKLTPAARVVISGHLSGENISDFLNDLLNKDRNNSFLDVILLGEEPPNRELRKSFNKYWNVRYCIGSLLESKQFKSIFGDNDTGRSKDSLVLLVDRSNPNILD